MEKHGWGFICIYEGGSCVYSNPKKHDGNEVYTWKAQDGYIILSSGSSRTIRMSYEISRGELILDGTHYIRED
jgi:hypothetical protein